MAVLSILLIVAGSILAAVALAVRFAGGNAILSGIRPGDVPDMAKLNRWAGNRLLVLPVVSLAFGVAGLRDPVYASLVERFPDDACQWHLVLDESAPLVIKGKAHDDFAARGIDLIHLVRPQPVAVLNSNHFLLPLAVLNLNDLRDIDWFPPTDRGRQKP